MCRCNVRTLYSDNSPVSEVPDSVVMLFTEDGGDLFAVEVLLYIEMSDCLFEVCPLLSVHCSYFRLCPAVEFDDCPRWRSGGRMLIPTKNSRDIETSGNVEVSLEDNAKRLGSSLTSLRRHVLD